MEDGRFYPMIIPWDGEGQARTHNPLLINGYLSPVPQSQVLINQRMQIEADTYTGVEAWDYQNPYVWMASGLLTVPSLVPDYPAIADTPQSIAQNIAQHQGELLV